MMTSQPTYSQMFETPFQYGQMTGGFGTGMGLGYNMNMGMQHQEQGSAMVHHDPVYDSAAFDNAFDAAAAEMLQSDRELDELLSSVSKDFSHEDAAPLVSERSDLEALTRESHDLALDERMQHKEELTPAQTSDALAETAGQLLDNISHETSDKFAQSTFLALMRRLRDREVKVEGDDFIEVRWIGAREFHVTLVGLLTWLTLFCHRLLQIRLRTPLVWLVRQ